jgi:hypothetical protein
MLKLHAIVRTTVLGLSLIEPLRHHKLTRENYRVASDAKAQLSFQIVFDLHCNDPGKLQESIRIRRHSTRCRQDKANVFVLA